ncbi:MAG: hypothetical protein JWP13_900 [Candidatus Saccharibacteria bacterium]|nr:hypothetical protein [Candidatus Saccharibacteria bacterium]
MGYSQEQNPVYPQEGQVQHSPQQYVYVTRPHEPLQPVLSEEQKRKHEASKKKYPFLNLSEGEFVISAVDRHFIGLFQIWAVVGTVIALLFLSTYAFAGGAFTDETGQPILSPAVMAIPAILLTALALLFGFVATSIYNANKFFLTNESVIQLIQVGLFSKREQTVSLANIEDASYNQHGIVPHMFNYGLLRLSTEGDETTYRFNYASRPQKQIAILNNAVEAFKNGRPVSGNDD